jgi:hypothetical protein
MNNRLIGFAMAMKTKQAATNSQRPHVGSFTPAIPMRFPSAKRLACVACRSQNEEAPTEV